MPCSVNFNNITNCNSFNRTFNFFPFKCNSLFSAIDLSQALNPESMIPILANAEVQERLVKYLPEGQELPKTEEELRNTVSSPQFQQVSLLHFQQLSGPQLQLVKGYQFQHVHTLSFSRLMN